MFFLCILSKMRAFLKVKKMLRLSIDFQHPDFVKQLSARDTRQAIPPKAPFWHAAC